LNGISIIIIILVPIFFQVVWQGYKADKRHEELKQRLDKLEIELLAK
jgi:hypothetical protein